MEKKYITSNNNNQINRINKKTVIKTNQTKINSQIKKSKINNNEILPKKSETTFYTKMNTQINRPKRYARPNSKELIDNNIKKPNKLKEKENILELNRSLDKTERKPDNNNKIEERIKNIKVNKINFNKIEIKDSNNNINNNIRTNTNINYQPINTIYLAKNNKNSFINTNLSNRSFGNDDYNYNNKANITIKRLDKEFSKIRITFKDMKTFCAHIEIFISLYLKKWFKYFLQKIELYDKSKINKNIIFNNDEFKDNKFRPIVNVNNSHCALYYSINVNQDKLINSLLTGKNFPSFSENTYTPLTKKIQNKMYNDHNISKRNKNNIIPIELNFNSDNSFQDKHNSFNYSKKTLKRKINRDLINDINKVQIENNNSSIDTKIKISPIKEMNINIGNLNRSNLFGGNKGNINDNYKTNLINKMKNTNTDLFHVNLEKNKLKKIKSLKNDIYIKPKENVNKQPIKEIKITNKLSNKKVQTNINIYNSFNKIKPSKISKKSNEKILNNEQNTIKKIYIKRGSQISNNFSVSNISHYNSTFINFKADNEKSINDVLLIKEIQTSDNRLFINIKYMTFKKQNFIKNLKKLYYGVNEQIVRLYSISILNKKIYLNKELYENLKMYNLNNYKDIVNYCFFDNDKFKHSKNIINLINKIRAIISNKILKIISKKYAKRILLKTLLNKKYKRTIKFFFSKFIYNSQIRTDNSIKVIYHKINYNDDFNKNSRFQTPKNGNKFKRIINSKQYTITHKNSMNKNNFTKKLIENQQFKESFSNNTYKVNRKRFNKINIPFNKISQNQTENNTNV